jgi:nucleoside-diphosphate kinase
MVLGGIRAVNVVRAMLGPTKGHEAPPGTIRGDFSMSTQANMAHASDSLDAAKTEVKRFFSDKELFNYNKLDFDLSYSDDEK